MTEKGMNVYNGNIKRTKAIVLNNRSVDSGIKVNSEGYRKTYINEVENVVKTVVKKNPRTKINVEYKRKDGDYNQKELEVSRSANRNDMYGLEHGYGSYVDLKKRREKESGARRDRLKNIYTKQRNQQNESKKEDVLEWKEQVVRVGTGFRVRKDEKDPQRRRFDVGYADVKPYKRKEGREAQIDSSSMSRTITGKGKDVRVKVMNAVCDIEKRRPASKYTGSGIRRKSMVGKLKLKSTKAGGKD